MHERPRTPDDKNGESRPETLSRREFLIHSGRALFLGVLSASIVGSELRHALAAEVKEGDSLPEGLRRLRKETLTAYEEQFAFHITRNDGSSGWENGWGESGGTTAMISLDSVDEIIAQKPRQLLIAHTHPVVGAYYARVISSEESKRIRESENPHLSIPPSFQDIMSAVGFEARYSNSEKKIENAAIDPWGVWKFEVDAGHPFAHDVLKRKQALESGVRKLDANKSVERFKSNDGDFFALPPATKEEFLLVLETRALGTIDEEARAIVGETLTLLRDFEIRYKKTFDALNTRALEYMKKSALEAPREEDAATMAKEYAALGAHVSFTPFHAIESSR